MTRFVLDCSITMAWCFSDEADAVADRVLDMLRDSHAIVPAIWPLEVCNVLAVAERRERISAEDADTFIEMVNQLPITVDVQSVRHAFKSIRTLARAHGISSYDAAYLDLAISLRLPLATLDKKLATVIENRDDVRRFH